MLCFASFRTGGNIPHRPGECFRIFCSSGVLICKYQKSSCRAALYDKLRKISFLNFVHCRSTDRFYSFSFFSCQSRNAPKYLFLTVYILSFTSAPPYNTFLPHTEQIISPLITFAPQCLQYLASSSSGAQFTHISISGLYTTESTHLPHRWHKLKIFSLCFPRRRKLRLRIVCIICSGGTDKHTRQFAEKAVAVSALRRDNFICSRFVSVIRHMLRLFSQKKNKTASCAQKNFINQLLSKH